MAEGKQFFGADEMLAFIRMGTCDDYPMCPHDNHYFCKQALPAENTWSVMIERVEALENAWQEFLQARGKMYMNHDEFYMSLMEVELHNEGLRNQVDL